MAMVDSDKGITNLHVPSDVIVDASMPAMIRTSGHMCGPDGDEHDTLAVIPTRATPASTRRHRRLPCQRRLRPGDHGLGAERRPHGAEAEEYGSHDKTFQAPGDGTIRVVNAAGDTLLEHEVAR